MSEDPEIGWGALVVHRTKPELGVGYVLVCNDGKAVVGWPKEKFPGFESVNDLSLIQSKESPSCE